MTKTQYLNFNEEINKIDPTLLKKKLENHDMHIKTGFNSTMSSYSTTSKLNHSSYLSNPAPIKNEPLKRKSTIRDGYGVSQNKEVAVKKDIS
jgi:hypothetical protein